MAVNRTGSLLALATIVAAVLLYHVYGERQAEAVNVPIEEIPLQLGPWKAVNKLGLDIRSQEILRLTHYIKRVYANERGEQVFVYLGYWQEQTGDYQAAKHSPVLCLPSSGWGTERLKKTIIHSADGSVLETNRILGTHQNQQHLFYFWFFAGEKEYTEDWYALITISLQRLFAGRSDGGIVEVSVPLEPGQTRDAAMKSAEAAAENFLSFFYPELRRLQLPASAAAPEAAA